MGVCKRPTDCVDVVTEQRILIWYTYHLYWKWRTEDVRFGTHSGHDYNVLNYNSCGGFYPSFFSSKNCKNSVFTIITQDTYVTSFWSSSRKNTTIADLTRCYTWIWFCSLTWGIYMC